VRVSESELRSCCWRACHSLTHSLTHCSFTSHAVSQSVTDDWFDSSLHCRRRCCCRCCWRASPCRRVVALSRVVVCGVTHWQSVCLRWPVSSSSASASASSSLVLPCGVRRRRAYWYWWLVGSDNVKFREGIGRRWKQGVDLRLDEVWFV